MPKIYLIKRKKITARYRENNRDKIRKTNREYHYKIAFGGNRDKVLERDNWACTHCGLNNEQHILIFGMSITIDHIDGNRQNNDLNNLQTLCCRCNGRKDNLRTEPSSRFKKGHKACKEFPIGTVRLYKSGYKNYSKFIKKENGKWEKLND